MSTWIFLTKKIFFDPGGPLSDLCPTLSSLEFQKTYLMTILDLSIPLLKI